VIKAQLKIQPWGRRAFDDMVLAADRALTEDEGSVANVTFSLSSRTLLEENLWVFTDKKLLLVSRPKSRPEVRFIPLIDIVASVCVGERITLFGRQGFTADLRHTGAREAVQALAHSIQVMHEYFVSSGQTSVLAVVSVDETLTCHGLPGLIPGRSAYVEFHSDRLAFESAGGGPVEVPLASIDAVGVGGPGVVTKKGGFIGGGFGLEGMAIGMAASSVLNLLTRRKQVETLIMVKGATCEFVGVSFTYTPLELDSVLAPAYTALRAFQRSHADRTSLSTGWVADELSRLVELRDAGHISSEEYKTLKDRIIGS